MDRIFQFNSLSFPEDLAFVSRAFEELYRTNAGFGAEDVHRLLLAHPEIAAVNANRVAS